MTYPAWEIWTVIVVLGAGTFLLRFSFLALLADRKLPGWLERHLRYTAVAVLPGLVAPLAVWPAATGGAPDPVRIAAAIVTVAAGVALRSTPLAILAGAVALYGLLWMAG